MWRERLRHAGYWLIREEAGDLSEAERRQFEAWAKDSENVRAYHAAQRTLAKVRTHRRALAGMAFEKDKGAPQFSRRVMMSAGAVAASAMLVAGLWLQFGAPQTYATDIGSHRQIALADGSEVFLNTDSIIRVQNTHARRDVTLVRGEAFFEVARDRDRPFIVRTDAEEVRAIGTAFVVRRHEDGVAVMVREGRVSVAHLDADEAAQSVSRMLLAGERYERRGQTQNVSVMSDYDIGRSLAWREGMLWFEGEPLSHVLDEFSRHTGVSFVLTDPELAEVAITAYVRADNIETFAARIEEAYPNIVVSRAGEEIIIARRNGTDRSGTDRSGIDSNGAGRNGIGE